MIEGLPLWAGFLAIILSGGVGAAALKIVDSWVNGRSTREISGSQIRLNDVGALNQAIAGLSGENGRMAKRMTELEVKIAVLELALDERDKRIDVLEEELEEQRSRRHEMELHLALAEKRIDTLATEMKKQGLDPGPIIGVPF
jgi:chromosome condensin MukBEF ATPase and DNA-binding subunit MukB